MKKIFGLMLLCATMFIGCSPIDDDFHNGGNLAYNVNVDIGLQELANQYNAEATLNVVFMEYNDKNEMINNQTWYNAKDNDTKKVYAHKLATKLVIYLEVEVTMKGETASTYYYVAQVYYLEDNMNIKVDGQTRTSKTNPIN